MTTAVKQDQVAAQPQSKLEEMVANLEFRENEKLAIVRYEDLKVGEGHAQGDLKIQFLGEIDDQVRNQLTKLEEFRIHEGTPIADTSHLMHGPMTLFKPTDEHPLIANLLFTNSGFEVRHDEHSWVQFTQRGWYAFRFDRTGAEPEHQIGRPLRTAD